MALESCWNARDLRCAIEEVRNQNSGVRSCRICEQGLYPKIRDRHLPGKISAGIPDSFLAPELLQLLNSEFWNVESGHRQVSPLYMQDGATTIVPIAASQRQAAVTFIGFKQHRLVDVQWTQRKSVG